jgi:hypothetical protein
LYQDTESSVVMEGAASASNKRRLLGLLPDLKVIA